MSRIGKRSIHLPQGVAVSREGQDVTVIGPKGTLKWTLPFGIDIVVEGGVLSVHQKGTHDRSKAYHGLSRALLANMVQGVSEGFAKQLKIVGVGYRAELTGQGIKLSLGFSHPIEVAAPTGIAFSVDKNVITITGIDKQLVGEISARIRAFKKPEPYKGKGIMYTDELVRRKPGKAAKTVGAGAGA